MKNKLYASFILAFILGISIAYATPSIYVDPPTVTSISPGNTFTVNIKIDNVNDLAGFQFRLSWNPNILFAPSYDTTGNLWENNGNLTFIPNLFDTTTFKNNVKKGEYLVALTKSDNSVPTFSGSATLSTITFSVKSYGSTALHLYDVKLGDSNINPINVIVTNGSFSNSGSCVIIGDINSDGTVNILDAIIMGNSFLATPDSSNWNPNADLNNDNAVNILDAIILGNHFGETCPV
jgi:hypothetical protein